MQELLAAFDDERRRLSEPGFDRMATPQLIRHVGLDTPHSFIGWSRHEEATLDSAIDREIEYFSALGHEFEWKVFSYDEPNTLRERLAARGFAVGPEERLLVCEARALLNRLPADTVDVRQVQSEETAADFNAVKRAVWQDAPDPAADAHMAALLLDAASGSVGYVAYVDGQAVGCARMSFHARSRFAGLWAGSVLAPYRGRGVYLAMIRRRVEEALRRRATWVTVDALPTSEPILRGLGFEELARTWPCVWSGSDTSMPDAAVLETSA